MDDAKEAGCWVTKDFCIGDVVIFDFPGGAKTDHCGIVESVNGRKVTTIEGNTGSTSDADGGQVQRRTRDLSEIVGAVRPNYENEEEQEMRYNTVAECPDWAQATVKKLVNRGFLNGNGTGLNLSEDMLRLLVILDRAGAFDGR